MFTPIGRWLFFFSKKDIWMFTSTSGWFRFNRRDIWMFTPTSGWLLSSMC
jgi:hypothetical protein